ncbi:MAG: hypothetical protein ABIK45_03500 [Pseudomonadota bacterium]
MNNDHAASKHIVEGFLVALALCICLLIPASALAYGGGGGDSVGSSFGGVGGGGPDFQSIPSGLDTYPGQIGIEGVMVEPAPGTPGSGYFTPQGKPSPQPSPADSPWNWPGYGIFKTITVAVVKKGVIEVALAGNPKTLIGVKVANGVYTIIAYGKPRVERAKKDYQKALMGTMGSNLQVPGPEIPEMNSISFGGGGPGVLHDPNTLQ